MRKQVHDVCVVAAVNDNDVLMRNLASSPLLEIGVELIELRGCRSAAEAYNRGLAMTDAAVVVFAHQDVYLPCAWLERVQSLISVVEAGDPAWAVIGVYGLDASGAHVGRCWSSGLGRELGSYFEGARKVVSIDELVIILRHNAGLSFDEGLPGFHLYGTDIVQIALAAGRGAYVIHAPVVHNSKPVRTLAGAYTRSYKYMQKKWKTRLPLPTAVVAITRYGYPLIRSKIRKAILRRHVAFDGAGIADSGSEIARRVGYE